MHYYEVWPSDQSYHKNEPLTYHQEQELKRGQVVEVSIKQKTCTGFITRETKKPPYKTKALTRVIDSSIIPTETIDLFDWLRTYYPAPSGQICQLFTPKNLPKIQPQTKDPGATNNTQTMPPLTPAQQKALQQIKKTNPTTSLLHGDTGTGKTRIYAELAKEQLTKNKSVVILTPEIGLTPQLLAYFKEYFGSRVIVTHSKLTPAQRRDIWQKVASSTEPYVVIGPRSALFLPHKSLGLIVIDEAHDGSYKQEQAPHYNATRVAAKLASLHSCACVLGTATPPVSDYFALDSRKNPIIRLKEPVHENIKPPSITVVDRTNKENFSQSSLLSSQLIEQIKQTHSQGLMSLLFLNRRGTARNISCQSCGWIATCPRCDLPLTYHHDKHILRCHTCSHSEQPPLQCPECHSTELLYKTAGTKALVQEVERLFPNLKIKKFDSDDEIAEQLHTHYDNLKKGNFDVIIGTQMLAKGLDLPKLGLVGIPFADTSLYLPDYTADEQTYQQLSQVIGRVGRTENSTKAVLQSYNPDHPAIQAAIHKDWESFYKNELAERKQFHYPPYRYLLRLIVSKKTEQGAQRAATNVYKSLQESQRSVEILPPAPRFHAKSHGNYHWQILIKAKDRNKLLKIYRVLPPGWRYDIDPISLL